MEQKKPVKKLVLSKETVRTLKAPSQQQENAQVITTPCRQCLTTI